MADVLNAILRRLEWPELPTFSRQETKKWDPVLFNALLKMCVLVEIAPARTVECDGCENGCFVEVDIQRHGEKVQGFSYCGRFGMMEVDLNDLKHWAVSMENLSKQIAKTLSLNIEVVEIYKDIWSLGHRYIGRRRRDFYFLRSARVTNNFQTSLTGFPFAVVFVPVTLPVGLPPDICFFPLARYSNLSESGINIGLLDIESALSSGKMCEPAQIIPFQTTPGTKWEQISIRFISDEEVKITVKGQSRTIHFSEMGFKDRRKGGQPTKLWLILRLLAEHNGQIAWGDLKLRGQEDKLKHNVSELRKCLKAYFVIDDDPFYPYKEERSYRTRFIIEDFRYGG